MFVSTIKIPYNKSMTILEILPTMSERSINLSLTKDPMGINGSSSNFNINLKTYTLKQGYFLVRS